MIARSLWGENVGLLFQTVSGSQNLGASLLACLRRKRYRQHS
jgi:hypothetical protein